MREVARGIIDLVEPEGTVAAALRGYHGVGEGSVEGCGTGRFRRIFVGERNKRSS